MVYGSVLDLVGGVCGGGEWFLAGLGRVTGREIGQEVIDLVLLEFGNANDLGQVARLEDLNVVANGGFEARDKAAEVEVGGKLMMRLYRLSNSIWYSRT